MKALRTVAALAALATLAVAVPASAAQIILTSSMIIGSAGGPYTFPGTAIDQQTGEVSSTPTPWKGGFGARVVFDLGKAYDFSRFDIFSIDDIVVNFVGGNQVSFEAFTGYELRGATTALASGSSTADAGDANGNLAAQTLLSSDTTNTFRYLALYLSDGASGRDNLLNEIRLYDGDEPLPGGTPVPEPATWALMIAGFGLAGSALRRRQRFSPA